MIHYKQIQVEDCKVFYREAGDASKPTILLLHGFPSSSHISSAYALETIIGQYTLGTPEDSVGPDGYTLDYHYACQPGRAEMQNDSSSVPAGANAFKRDLPNAEVHFVPSGHFALESHHTEIARLMKDYFRRLL
jgi:pimeloyl-ACP methyl ester carboxylesterase